MPLPSAPPRENVGDLWIAIVARAECANYLTPFRFENRIPRQGHGHTRTSFGRNRELIRSSGVNPLRTCDTGRDEQTDLLVVFGRKRDPLIEKRPVDRPP